eukprot:g7156.t1
MDDLIGRVEWRLLQASSCLGNFMLPQPQRKEVCQDHWDAWFSMFGTSRQACTTRALKKGRRKLSKRFHPDKLKHAEWCAKTMSMLINAGFDVLSQHESCGGTLRES